MPQEKICFVGNKNLTNQAIVSVLKTRGFIIHSDNYREMFEENQIYSIDPEVVILEEQVLNVLGSSVFDLWENTNAKFQEVFMLSNRSMYFLGLGLTKGINGFVHVNDGLKELEDCLSHVWEGVMYISPLFSGPKTLNGNKEKKLSVDNATITSREEKILKLVKEKKTSKEIGNILNISAMTGFLTPGRYRRSFQMPTIIT